MQFRAATQITGMAELVPGLDENIRYLIVEGKSDTTLFKRLIIEPVYFGQGSGKEGVFEAINELRRRGYKSGIGIVDPDYDDSEEAECVFMLDKNNLESMLFASEAFETAINDLSTENVQIECETLREHVVEQSKDMVRIRIHCSKLPADHSPSLSALGEAVNHRGFDIAKFARISLSKPQPRGEKHLKKMQNGDIRGLPADFNANKWRWINGKDALDLVVAKFNHQSGDVRSIRDTDFKKSMISSYEPHHFREEVTLVTSISEWQTGSGVVLFKEDAVGSAA